MTQTLIVTINPNLGGVAEEIKRFIEEGWAHAHPVVTVTEQPEQLVGGKTIYVANRGKR